MINKMKTSHPQQIMIGPRLKEARLLRDLTLAEFYTPITRHIGNCSSIENGKRIIGKRLTRDIAEYHHINLKFLTTGTGEIFTKPIDDRQHLLPATQHGVPFFNVDLADATFGTTQVFQETAEYYVNYKPFNDCNAYLPIYGESMHPKFSSGEIIIVKEILNRDIVQWGEAYLIVTDEQANNMTTVKLLFEHEDQGKIILRSLNPEFKGDTIISRNVIRRMFIIKGKVTRVHL
ncbi:hypothetical protein PBAL39_03749 [Pedobacter sp. BAL39]|nr:hypothetical protein PBAL39_03749 [Pedobacter sp. BAL39]